MSGAAADTGRSWPRALAPVLVAAACVAVYAGGLHGVFLFDDRKWIVDNEALHALWPPWGAMGLSFRQLAFYSFAVNHAVSGHDTWSYHVVNVVLHVLAALTLLGLVRRTLLLPRIGLREPAATGLALAVALLWAVHPLNSQAVMYVVQRAELMASLATLFMLYAFARAIEQPGPAHRRRWYAAVVGAFLLGLASKETIATAPLTLYLYDAVPVSGSFREPLRRRWPLYAALAAPFLVAPLAWLVVDPERFVLLRAQSTAPGRTDYLFAQGLVIVEYLRLAVWPVGLNLDHAWSPADHEAALAPAFALVATLFAGAVEAARRHAALGWLGLSFFLALAPSSSLFPLVDYLVEHRMYLALIPCITLAVLAAHRALGAVPSRRGRGALAVALLSSSVLVLGSLTVARTGMYDDRVAMWTDVLARSPQNVRARFNLGVALLEQDPTANEERALVLFRRVLELDPSHAKAQNNTGTILFRRGAYDEAARHFRIALADSPKQPPEFLANYGNALLRLDRCAEAAVVLERALHAIRRGRGKGGLEAGVRCRLGVCRERLGDTDAALAEYRRAAELDPLLDDARANLVRLLVAAGRLDDAAREARAACEGSPRSGPARLQLARVLARSGAVRDAVEAYVAALALLPEDAAPRLELLQLCMRPAHRAAAEEALGAVTERDPGNEDARRLLEMLREVR